MAASDVDVSSLELPTHFSHGIAFPKLFQTEHLEESFSFRPHDDNIILRTYPKCGTNWAMHMVLHLLHYEDFDGDLGKAHQSCSFLEKLGTKNVKPGSFVMTHMPFNAETFNPNAKCIIVLRNPRDVAVSYYHFATQIATAIGGFPKDVDWFSRFAELFVKGGVWYGDYMEYHRDKLEGLRKHGKPENILYLVYEKMKKDPRGEIIRIANFLGGKAATLVKDEKVVATIVERTSVEFMKESSKKMQKKASENRDGAPNMLAAVQFVRKGVVGDHVNYFTPEISKMFDDYIASDPRNKEIMDLFNV